MLDVSTLMEMREKTSNAQLAETCCEMGSQREGLLEARACRLVRLSEDLSLCLDTPRRRRVAGQAEGVGFATTSVRLPASGAALGSARGPDQSQEALPALQRGAAVGA
jgi:hypothetical protein